MGVSTMTPAADDDRADGLVRGVMGSEVIDLLLPAVNSL
jgi:hypothetical protein